MSGYIKIMALLLLLFVIIVPSVYGSADTTGSKANMPATFFQQRNIEGSSTARVTGTDVGLNNIVFVDPYSSPSTMTIWAGFFKGTIDGNAARFYCIDISHSIAYYSSGQPHSYTDNGNTPSAITYILNNYYPYKSLPYTGGLTAAEEAASVQIAIWHFSDGVNAGTVTNTTVKNRAALIIADAVQNSCNAGVLSSFAVLPLLQTAASGSPGVLYAKALDNNGAPVANLNVSFTSTSGSLSSSSSVTDATGVTANINLLKGVSSQATVTAATVFTIPQGTKYEHTASPNGYQKLVLATPTSANRSAQAVVSWSDPAPNCSLAGFATYTQGGWGSASNSGPGSLRDSKFSTVFPLGMKIGGDKWALFTSASAIKDFLPAGGTASAFVSNYTNPGSTSAGVFGGQLVALNLNVKFSDAGFFGTSSIKLGQLVITSGPLTGKTVYELLNYANTVIGGSSSPYSISELNTAADEVNNNFDNGTQDLGYLTCPASQPVIIGDRLWIDSNKNGIQDDGESGFAGATVSLYDCNNNLKASTITDNAGNYLFSNVAAGSYYIRFALPAGYSFTVQNAGTDDSKDSDADPATGKTACRSFTSACNDLTWDAGIFYDRAKLGDRVWNDVNANGVQNEGEDGISGVTVKLYTCTGTLTAAVTTDVNGNYLFSDLVPGSYYVNFTLPSGFVFSPKNQGTDTGKDSDPDVLTGNTACVTLVSGANNLTVDAGVHTQRAAIGNYVWNDQNKNGVQDDEESGIANVTVKLFDCSNNLTGTTATDSTGLYKFTDLTAGSYYLQFILPSDYNFTLKNQGGNSSKDSDPDPTTGKTACTPLTAGQTDLSWDAGMFFSKAKLGDRVWNDVNENGTQDAGESGVPGVTVSLYDCSNNNLISTATTGQDGKYLFSNLSAGSYYIIFNAPAGYQFSAKNQGSDSAKDSDPDVLTGKTACVTLSVGETNTTIDAGIFVKKVSIGDFVWKDTNHNGIQDSGETGVEAITVKLFDCGDNFIGSAETNDSGYYRFSNLAPGSYYVKFMLPAGYAFSEKGQGADTSKNSDADPLTGKTDCIMLSAGMNDYTRDAGIYQPKASIGDKVWCDLNHDGVQDNPLSELGIPNVIVKLFSCSGTLLSTATTDAQGNYLFSELDPGSYYIQYFAPAGYALTLKNRGTDTTRDSDADSITGITDCFTLWAGRDDLSKDCGMYPVKCSVGDFVWKDVNMNGIQDNGENGIPGVVVRLYDCTGDVMATTVTDNGGYYGFSNLLPGGYYVQFYPPSGYSISPKMQGANAGADSDPDPLSGKTACVTLNPAENIVTWDAGMYETAATYSDLSVTKTADALSVQNNDVVTYTVTVKNNGPGANSNVTLSDVLPSGLVYISSSPAGYDTSSGIWTVGALAAGESRSLQIMVRISVPNINNTVVDLGPAKPYNMFVIEDMTIPSSDTQGKLAVGRDAYLTGYSVGDQLPNSNGTEDVLVVGRDLTFIAGRVYNGNVVYGNSTNLPKYSVSIDEGSLRKDTVVDFAAAKTYLNSLSTQLASQIVNGTTLYQPYNEVTMTGTDPFLNIFMVDGAQLSNANNTSITVPNGSVVLVNISGNKVSWGYGLSVNGTAYNNAIYNFYEADSLLIHGIDIIGSVLAPRASVNFIAGVQHGQMICKSYTGQGQMNLDPFVGNLPICKDIVNIVEVQTADKYDPDSSPNNGNPNEDDYAAVNVHVGVPSPGSPNFRLAGTIPGGNTALTITNNSEGQVFAGTSGGRIYSSANDGAAWTILSGSMGNAGNVWSIAFGQAKSQRIIAGTDKGVYISDNNGVSWISSSLIQKDVRSIITTPDGRMYAAVWNGGVYKSIDQGHTWMAMNTWLTSRLVNSLRLDNNNDLIAATFGGGICKYSAISNAWIAMQIDYPYIWSLHTGKNGMLYATTYGAGVYRSENGGGNWSRINSGLTNPYIYSIAEDKNDNLVAISWSGGVFQLASGSALWTGLGLDGGGISAVAINSVSNAILVGAKDGSVYSKNGPLGIRKDEQIPVEFALSQNYPNPFNPSTKINFSIPAAGKVTLNIYNILGQQVAKLVDEEMNPGNYTVMFEGRSLASGIYIYRLNAGSSSLTKKMMFIK